MARNETIKPWSPNKIGTTLRNMVHPETPEDEFEDEYSFTEPGTSGKPIETDLNDVMEILNKKEPTEDAPIDIPETIPEKPRTRVKSFAAPTPSQLVDKINEYLNKVETDPRLANLTVHDVQYSSNDQGYSALIILKLN